MTRFEDPSEGGVVELGVDRKREDGRERSHGVANDLGLQVECSCSSDRVSVVSMCSRISAEHRRRLPPTIVTVSVCKSP